jgi:ferric-dicitrate binding protein FerR (iron transport regulator)
MNDESINPEIPMSAEQDAMLAELIRSGGRREAPPEAHYQQILATAEQALNRKREQLRRRQQVRFAMAASVCVAVLGSWFWLNSPNEPFAVQIARAVGTVEWRPAAAQAWQPVAASQRLGADIGPGAEFRTQSDAGLSFRMGDLSVRVAANSSLTLNANDNIYLRQGKLYLDSGQDVGSSITVITPAAVATDIGTQFEVRFVDLAYRLRVRSGEVRLVADMADTENLNGTAGDEFSIANDGKVERSTIAADDPEWQWAEALAPAPGIEGEPLALLLDWVSRETGRELVFASPIIELNSKQTIMHGSVDNLAPLAALNVVLATTDFRAATTEEGKILITAISPTD